MIPRSATCDLDAALPHLACRVDRESPDLDCCVDARSCNDEPTPEEPCGDVSRSAE